jgi:hypothetical protein
MARKIRVEAQSPEGSGRAGREGADGQGPRLLTAGSPTCSDFVSPSLPPALPYLVLVGVRVPEQVDR